MNPTPYRHAADRIVSRIAVPVLREPVFFCFMLLTFVWPQLTSDLFRIEATHWEILGLYIAYAYAATLPLGILGGKARRWYKTAAYTLAYAVSMAECFLLVFFRTFITPSLMSIATDTDPAESAEFIGCYLFTGKPRRRHQKKSQARRTAPMPHAGLRTCLLKRIGQQRLRLRIGLAEKRITRRSSVERRSAPEICGCRPSTATRSGACTNDGVDCDRLLHVPLSGNRPHPRRILQQTPCSIVVPAADDAPTVAGRGGGPYPFTDVVSPANFTVKAMHPDFASQDRQTAWCPCI